MTRPIQATASMRRRGPRGRRIGLGDDEHAGRDHGRGVDERGAGRGAFHGVGQPDEQRQLRGLAHGAAQDAEAATVAAAAGM